MIEALRFFAREVSDKNSRPHLVSFLIVELRERLQLIGFPCLGEQSQILHRDVYDSRSS